MTIAIHELTAATCPDGYREASLRGQVRRIAETGEADPADAVPEGKIPSLTWAPATQACADIFFEPKARLELPARQKPIAGDLRQGGLQRFWRISQ